jgi:hypothetical protein
VEYDASTLEALTDHVLLTVHLPFLVVASTPTPEGTTGIPQVTYRWEEGTCVQDYATSSHNWTKYTESPAFQARFSSLVADVSCTNEERANNVEHFLLQEAV